MGFSLSWLAVHGKPPHTVQEDLGVQPTGQREECPDSPIVGANLSGGWYLVVENRFPRFLATSVLRRVSRDATVVTCCVEEHVMYCDATGWKDGRETWSVVHDSNHGIYHIEANGDLPPITESIRQRLTSEQDAAGGSDAGVDHIFDIPLDLAESLSGFRHDRVTGQAFEVLEDVKRGILDRVLKACGFR